MAVGGRRDGANRCRERCSLEKKVEWEDEDVKAARGGGAKGGWTVCRVCGAVVMRRVRVVT